MLADPIDSRPGFAAMLERIASNGLRVIIEVGLLNIERVRGIGACWSRSIIRPTSCIAWRPSSDI